jgi:peptide/nickel transport system substrate-binding protein
MAGGGTSETVDGQTAFLFPDYARAYALFDHLIDVGPTGELVNRLAVSLEPNRNATIWTIKLRPGVTFHNGKPLAAEDVLYSFQRIFMKDYPGVLALGPMDLKSSRVLDPLTLEVHFSAPYGIFPEGLTTWQNVIVPVGFNPSRPVGTGPFAFESFTAGQQSVFKRNPSYWKNGRPYLDELVLIDFSDETAMVDALQSGQVDAATFLSAVSINAAKGAGANILVSKTGAWGPLTMRTDLAPFSDPRVRQAMRLLPDRQQILEQAFDGYGTAATDCFGIYDPAFAGKPLPPVEQDLDQAKSLLAGAGYPDLRLTLTTTPGTPGIVETAEIFATQAQGAGVQVSVIIQPDTQYFANSYLKVPFSTDYFPLQPYLSAVQLATVKGAPYNSTHESNARYAAWFKEASTTLNTSRRDAIMIEMRYFDAHQGGNVIPWLAPVIDAVQPTVHGVGSSVVGFPMGGYNWPNIWMES